MCKTASVKDEFSHVNLDELKKDLDDLGKELRQQQGPEDEDHLQNMIMWTRGCFWGGFLTSWIMINPISILLMAMGTSARWGMIGHHICHGGYDKCHSNTNYNRRTYALGWRRALDWLDWMLPEAWNAEHNQLHHYQLGESGDPDLVERNTAYLQATNPIVRWVSVIFFMATWKWSYYAPNTLKEYKLARLRGKVDKSKYDAAMTIANWGTMMELGLVAEFILRVLAPYALWQFGVLPGLFYFISEAAWKNALYSAVFAELATNIHSFIVIVTNHCGDDIYRFETPCVPSSGEFYLRQIIGSVNFSAGTDSIDFFHCWLNYQIEHHIWPDLSMRSYQKAMPRVKAICKKHDVPYLQHNVFWRLKKTIDVMVGNTKMLVRN